MRNRNTTTNPSPRRAGQFTTFPAVREPIGLMDFLMSKGSMSRNKVKTLLTNRAVYVDKKITTQYNFELRPGMLVQISKSHRQKEFNSSLVKLVYEDSYLIVVEKNCGVPVVSNEKKRERTVCSILDDYMKRISRQRRIYGIHRLDREASGLMIFAKDERTKQNLQDNWERLVKERTYVAVVEGDVEKDRGVMASWMVDDRLYFAESPVNNAGEKAVTNYVTIKRTNGYSMLELELWNGRREQIRTHMAELGHPVVGDIRNGVGNDPIRRLALHAFRLCLHHPVTGELLQFETSYPMNFRKLLMRTDS